MAGGGGGGEGDAAVVGNGSGVSSDSLFRLSGTLTLFMLGSLLAKSFARRASDFSSSSFDCVGDTSSCVPNRPWVSGSKYFDIGGFCAHRFCFGDFLHHIFGRHDAVTGVLIGRKVCTSKNLRRGRVSVPKCGVGEDHSYTSTFIAEGVDSFFLSLFFSIRAFVTATLSRREAFVLLPEDTGRGSLGAWVVGVT